MYGEQSLPDRLTCFQIHKAESTSKVDCKVNISFEVMVRDCRLIGLIDLNPKVPHTADMIVGYMNDVIDIGVAGFR